MDGRELVFEKDDEGQYRALTENDDKNRAVDPGLVQAIIDALAALSK